jgi:hypothetical protein
MTMTAPQIRKILDRWLAPSELTALGRELTQGHNHQHHGETTDDTISHNGQFI